MRKSVITGFLLLCITPAIAQDYTKPYDYPIKPGQIGWDSLTTYAEKRTVSQIPPPFISRVTTPVLLASILNYPLLSEIFVFSSFQNGINKLRTNFPAFDSLLKRNDMPETVLHAYYGMDIKFVDSIANGFRIGEFMFKISFLEMIIAQKQFSELPEVQRKNLARVLHEKYLEKAALINKYASLGLSTTAWALGRLLPPEQFSHSELYTVFLTGGMPLHKTDLDKLLSAVNDYSKPY